MAMFNLHDPECDRYTCPNSEEVACTCPPLPPSPHTIADYGPVLTVTEQNTKLADITVDLKPEIMNPLLVRDEQDRPIGTAVVQFVSGGLSLRLILDQHTPQAFDLAQEPDRCRFNLRGTLQDGVFQGTVRLTSK